MQQRTEMLRNPSMLPGTPHTRAASRHVTRHANNASGFGGKSPFSSSFLWQQKLNVNELRLRRGNSREPHVKKAK